MPRVLADMPVTSPSKAAAAAATGTRPSAGDSAQNPLPLGVHVIRLSVGYLPHLLRGRLPALQHAGHQPQRCVVGSARAPQRLAHCGERKAGCSTARRRPELSMEGGNAITNLAVSWLISHGSRQALSEGTSKCLNSTGPPPPRAAPPLLLPSPKGTPPQVSSRVRPSSLTDALHRRPCIGGQEAQHPYPAAPLLNGAPTPLTNTSV